MANLSVIDKLQMLPSDLQQEAEDLIDFLLGKVIDVPDHVKKGIEKGQEDVKSGRIKQHEKVISKYSKYL